eukprot:5019954-Prymnesium_polylepis.1
MMSSGFSGASTRCSGVWKSASNSSFGSVTVVGGTSSSASMYPGSRCASIAARLRSKLAGADCCTLSWRQ